MTSTTLLPVSEHVLETALTRALVLIRDDRPDDARRALEVGTAAAELVEANERETLR